MEAKDKINELKGFGLSLGEMTKSISDGLKSSGFQDYQKNLSVADKEKNDKQMKYLASKLSDITKNITSLCQ